MKSILLHIDHDAAMTARLQVALDIARATNGHITCLQAISYNVFTPGDVYGAAVAAAIDAALPPPFERTAVNGFGFLQIVRPRPRPSIPEIVRSDPTAAASRALLRRLEREPPGAPLHHRVSAAVRARLLAHPDWLAELARRTGVTHRLDPA